MKKYLIISSILIIFIITPLITAGFIITDLIEYAKSPVASRPYPLKYEIRRGQHFEAVAQDLHEKGLIAHPVKFRIIARYTGHDRTMKFGEYRLLPTMTPLEILDRFTRGDVLLHRVTIPEGLTYKDVAARVESAGLCDKNAFIAIASDPGFARGLKIPADTVEGYLFPDTYHFEKSPSPETVIVTMVSRFRKSFSAEWESRATELGFNVHEVVTLASIIEKETGSAKERTIVSSVFHNRLEQKIPLGSDPTVIYGIENFDGNLTRTHLRGKTPYNTYVIDGLPPGPIANPGSAALEAALYPAKTKYLFFVAKPDRTHYFSTNYRDHSRAVQEYQVPKPAPAITNQGSREPTLFIGPTLPDNAVSKTSRLPSLLTPPDAKETGLLNDAAPGLTLNPALSEPEPLPGDDPQIKIPPMPETPLQDIDSNQPPPEEAASR